MYPCKHTRDAVTSTTFLTDVMRRVPAAWGRSLRACCEVPGLGHTVRASNEPPCRRASLRSADGAARARAQLRRDGRDVGGDLGDAGWLPNNLNQGRLDLYYTVLVLLSAANVLFFLLVAHFYQYKQVLPYPLSRQAPLPVRDCALFVLARPAGARAPGSLGSVVPASSWWRE